MLTRKVQKVKDSCLVTIPKQMCCMFGIDENTLMRIEMHDGKIVLYPIID